MTYVSLTGDQEEVWLHCECRTHCLSELLLDYPGRVRCEDMIETLQRFIAAHTHDEAA